MRLQVTQSEKNVLKHLAKDGTYIAPPYSMTSTYRVKHAGVQFALAEFRESTLKGLISKGYIDQQLKITDLGREAAVKKWVITPDREDGSDEDSAEA